VPKFTAENAAEMAKKSHKPGSARFFPKLDPVIEPAEPAIIGPEPAETAVIIDRFSLELTCVCEETLQLIKKSKEPIHRAQLARALRDLRETYHLATGKPRPGLSRELPARTSRREMPRVYPAVYPPDTGPVKPT